MSVIYNSFRYTVTILGLLLFILGMMAILGQSLFQGLLNYRCRLEKVPRNGKWTVNPAVP